MRILLVEDQESMRVALKAGLVHALRVSFPRCEISGVTTLSEALEIVAADPAPDFTILDLTLKDSGAVATIRRIDDFTTRCHTVILTGASEHEVRDLLGERKIEVIHKHPGMIAKIVTWMARVGHRESENLKTCAECLTSAKEILNGHA